MKGKIKVIIFWSIIVIAVLSRIIMWPNGLKEINCDEAMTAINANSIANTGKDIYGTSFPVYLEAWGYTGQSVMLCYIMAFFIKIFGASIFSVRLPLMLISIISLFVIYDISKRIFKNKDIALVILAILSICPWHIMQAKWSIDCNLLPHFMLIATDLLIIGIQSNKKFLYVSMLVFGLTMYTYGLSIYVVPLFLIFMAVYLIKCKQISIKEVIICIIIYTLISMPIILMYLVNLFQMEDINLGPITIQYFENTTRTNDMLIFSNNKLADFYSNLSSTIKTIFIQYDKLPWNGMSEFGTIYPVSIVFAVIGIVYLIKNKNKDVAYMIILWLMLSIFLGVNTSKVNINKLNIIWYPLIIVTGYGLYECCSNIPKYKKAVCILLVSVYLVMFGMFNYKYYTEHINQIETSFCWSNGLNTTMKYALDSDKENIKIDEEVLKNGACPIYVKFINEFYKNKNYEYTNEINLDENTAYVVKKENMKDELKQYIKFEVLDYIVLYK